MAKCTTPPTENKTKQIHSVLQWLCEGCRGGEWDTWWGCPESPWAFRALGSWPLWTVLYYPVSLARTSPSSNRRFRWWIAQHLALLARLLRLPPTFLTGSDPRWWLHVLASSWCGFWWCPSLAFWWPHLAPLWVQKAPWPLPLLLGFCPL